jgi:hypothetical protein
MANQKVPDGYYHLDRMLGSTARQGANIGCCGTCMDARGIVEEMLTKGTRSTSCRNGESAGGVGDVFGGGPPAEAQPYCGAGLRVGQRHRGQDRGRLRGTDVAGRSGGRGEVGRGEQCVTDDPHSRQGHQTDQPDTRADP